MNKKRLLTKLAMELAQWTGGKNDPIFCYALPYGWRWDFININNKLRWVVRRNSGEYISEQHWQQRRRELINEPADKDAPEWAEWIIQDELGLWYWASNKPTMGNDGFSVRGDKANPARCNKSRYGVMPAGHDWRKTLRRVKREERDKESTQDTNTNHEHDPVNHPKHYKLFPNLESIDVIQRALTPEQFAGFCIGNALKYRLRAGEKGDAAEDLAKANWYRNKLTE